MLDLNLDRISSIIDAYCVLHPDADEAEVEEWFAKVSDGRPIEDVIHDFSSVCTDGMIAGSRRFDLSQDALSLVGIAHAAGALYETRRWLEEFGDDDGVEKEPESSSN